MGHQHQISGLKPLVMKGKVVDMIENSLSSNTVCVVIDVDIPTQRIHLFDACALHSLTSWLVKLHENPIVITVI